MCRWKDVCTELSEIFHVRMIVRWHTHMDFLIEREKEAIALTCTTYIIHISHLNGIARAHTPLYAYTYSFPLGHLCKGKYQFIRGNSLFSAQIGYFYRIRLPRLVLLTKHHIQKLSQSNQFSTEHIQFWSFP